MKPKYFIPFLIFVLITGCAPTAFKQGVNDCQVRAHDPSWFDRYGSLICTDADGKITAAALSPGKSLGQAAMNMGTSAGLGIGVYRGLKAIQAGTEIIVP